MTLKSKIKEKALQERRLTAVEIKANASNKRTGFVQQGHDNVPMPTTLIENRNIGEGLKQETDRGLRPENKPSNYVQ